MDNADSERLGEPLKQLQIVLLGAIFAFGLQQIFVGLSFYLPFAGAYQNIFNGAALVVVFVIIWVRWSREW